MAGQCSPSRLVTVLLLFAEIEGGSKTKQAAPASNAPPGREVPTAARRREGKWVAERLWLLKQEQSQSPDASAGVQENKPAEASGSGDSASRLSRTGKPATKAGLSPSTRD